jgi:hypothetical protein
MTEETLTSLKEMFAFPFREAEWKNRFAVGSALIIANFVIPILPLIFVYGYVLQVMRQAIEDRELSLPAWDDWGTLATDGLRALVVGFVYLLPGLLISLGGMLLYVVSTIGVPLAEMTGDEGTWAVVLVVSIVIMLLSLFVGTVVTLLGAIPLPLATAQVVAEDDLSAAFRVRRWWSLLRANWLGYFVAWVVAAGLMSMLYLALMLAYYTVVLCCAIPVLTGPLGFYLMLVSAGLFGRFYREAEPVRSSTPAAEEATDTLREADSTAG